MSKGGFAHGATDAIVVIQHATYSTTDTAPTSITNVFEVGTRITVKIKKLY